MDQLHEEIMISKAELENELETPARFFCYPHGDFDENTLEFVRQAGFAGACSTPATSRFALPRTEIFGTFSIFRFLLAVWSGK